MAQFQNAVDVANRALQHVGQTRITAFTDDSKAASSVNFVYDKVRRAELRRNVWRFATRRAAIRPIDTTTLLFVPPTWSATIAYQVGAIVQDSAGVYWVNATPFNLNHTPGTDAYWQVYFGPLTLDLYDATASYFTGEMVYEDDGDGHIRVYSAVEQGPSVDPGTDEAWSATTTYNKGHVVLYTDGFYYISLVDQNLNETPNTYAMWNTNTTYAKNDIIADTDGKLYLSLVNANTGNRPKTDSLLYNPNSTNFGGAHWVPTGGVLPWTTYFSAGVAGNGWVTQEFAAPAILNFIYPVGSGPSSEATTRNVYRLPSGFLRPAPQDPKAGAVAFLGGPTGNMYLDWEYEGDYLVTRQSDTITLRFVADVSNVPEFDDMFCEGLALRIGLEICEELTQKAGLLQQLEGLYQKFMVEARTVNGIEVGPTEPIDDEFVSVRY